MVLLCWLWWLLLGTWFDPAGVGLAQLCLVVLSRAARRTAPLPTVLWRPEAAGQTFGQAVFSRGLFSLLVVGVSVPRFLQTWLANRLG